MHRQCQFWYTSKELNSSFGFFLIATWFLASHSQNDRTRESCVPRSAYAQQRNAMHKQMLRDMGDCICPPFTPGTELSKGDHKNMECH